MIILLFIGPQSIKINPKLTFNPPPPDTEVLIACFSTSSCFFLFLSTASGFLTPLYTVWRWETNGWNHKAGTPRSDMHSCSFVQQPAEETVTNNRRAFHCQIQQSSKKMDEFLWCCCKRGLELSPVTGSFELWVKNKLKKRWFGAFCERYSQTQSLF